jgi:hypothetical protein
MTERRGERGRLFDSPKGRYQILPCAVCGEHVAHRFLDQQPIASHVKGRKHQRALSDMKRPANDRKEPTT